MWQIEAKSISTSSAKTQFKLDGKRRKLDPNRPAPHTLRNRWSSHKQLFLSLVTLSDEWRNIFFGLLQKKPHHWLKFRKTLTYLAIALIATVAAPQVAHCLNISCHKYQSQISQTSKLLWKSMLIVQIFQVINKTIDYYEKRGEKKWSHELFKHITIIGRNSGDCKWQKIFIQCHCWVGIMSRKPVWNIFWMEHFQFFFYKI